VIRSSGKDSDRVTSQIREQHADLDGNPTGLHDRREHRLADSACFGIHSARPNAEGTRSSSGQQVPRKSRFKSTHNTGERLCYFDAVLKQDRSFRVRYKVALLGLLAVACGGFLIGCNFLSTILVHQGEQSLRPLPSAPPTGPRVIVFALDGVGYNQMAEAIQTGKTPHINALLGEKHRDGLFEHAYSTPHVVSVLPSSTVADWTAAFTGLPPAWNGIVGDEFFVRDEMQFYAPVPISVRAPTAFARMLADDVVGKELKVPTLFQEIDGDSYVSLLMVYKGATLLTVLGPLASADLFGEFVAGALIGESPEKSVSASVDLASVTKAVEAIDEHGVPKLQVIYFPGIDIYTHRTGQPLRSQVDYLERVTDAGVGEVLAAYERKGALDGTYVIFLADHGNTPVLNDARQALGAEGADTPFALLKALGFRVRRAALDLAPSEQDYQAVVAYQGFMANIYLADRSTCPHKGDRCDWSKPPRFKQDVMPVVEAFYRANKTGQLVSRLKGTIDLIFSREPAPTGQYARPFEVFDGQALVPISSYLDEHLRPDLVNLDQRMRWLAAGPYGNRAGDVVLLARASMSAPLRDRYYFAIATHYTWHGSANSQDSYIPFILAKRNESGERLQEKVKRATIASCSQMALTPLVRMLLRQ
jgi:hypothetical protein